MTNPIKASALWGGTGMLAGALLAAVAALPMRPTDPQGFEDLGWIVMTMLAAGVLALVGGAVGLHRALRGERDRAVTIAGYLPLALLLGFFSAGVGAVAAPPLARWLVELWAARRAASEPGGWAVRRGR